MTRSRLLVSGRVQGVGFRVHALNHGKDLGLTGWIRNLSDGRVEAHVEGTPEAVALFLAWCRQGPPAAKVAAVEEVLREEGPRQFEAFQITRE